MQLVRFDLIRERWVSYDIDSYEVLDARETSANPTDPYKVGMREPRVWRYRYDLWADERVTHYTGVAAIAGTLAAGRRMIMQFLRNESYRDVA